MRKALAGLYILGAISTAQYSYLIDVRRNTVEVPAVYVCLGVLWPVTGIIVSGLLLGGYGPSK